jgi:predicted MarR family transcription regulator
MVERRCGLTERFLSPIAQLATRGSAALSRVPRISKLLAVAIKMSGFRNHDLRQQVADLLGVTLAEYTSHQMTYDLRRLRLKGLIYGPPKTNRYFVTPYGWKVARLFSRLDARVFRPAMAMFTANDAVLPFPLRQALDRADAQLDLLIYEAFPFQKAV